MFDKLLRHETVKRWLRQFEGDEESLFSAKLLLSSLRLVAGSDVEKKIREKIALHASAAPSALFTLRKLSKAESSNHYFGSITEQRAAPKKIEHNFGSDGRMGHMTGQLARANPDLIFDHPSVAVMRRRRIRKVILLDDILASGTRAETFVRHLLRHTSVSSWVSYGFVEIVILAFAASTISLDKLARLKKRKVMVDFVTVDASLNELNYTAHELQMLSAFCDKFATNPGFGLGFSGTGGTMVFDYGCPNTVPQVLWRNSANHQALFPERSVPAELQKLFRTKGASDRVSERLSQSGYSDTARDLEGLPSGIKALAAFLGVVGRRARRGMRFYDNLSIYCGLDIDECKSLIAFCKKWRLISDSYRLTDAGRAELRRLRKTPTFDGLRLPYYPSALREQQQRF